MRIGSIAVLLALVATGLWWQSHRTGARSEQLVVAAETSARAWSRSQQSQEGNPSAPPVMMPSVECRKLNERIVHTMRTLHDEGHAPPFSPSPLLEILRTGNCSDDNPSVQVLLGWLAATRQPEPTPRSSEP